MLNEIEIISRKDTGHSNMIEILRVRRPSDKKEAVILFDWDRGQVHDWNHGFTYARGLTDASVSTVANWCSPRTALRRWRKATSA